MRLFIAVLLVTLGTQAWAERGKFCELDWWKTATTSDLKAKLDAGANVMARGEYDQTPLYYNASSGTPEKIQALTEAGADVMAKEEPGWTPLHYAAAYGEESGIVVSLLEAGADPKAINDHCETVWDLAKDNDALKDTKGYLALKLAQ